MGNPIYDPLPCLNKWSEQLHNPFWSEKKARSKASIDRALEQEKKKKSCVEEGLNADDSKDEEETTTGMRITMDTDEPGIDPNTEVIDPDMVITYASDGDRNSESEIDYEPEDNDDNVLGAKELPGSTSI